MALPGPARGTRRGPSGGGADRQAGGAAHRLRPDLAVADAYAIQRANVAAAVIAGRRRRRSQGRSRPRRPCRRCSVSHEPDFGVLTDDMVLPDGARSRSRPWSRRASRRRSRSCSDGISRGPGVTTADALAAVEVAVPALEIIDSRIADWRIKLVDTIADNGSCGRFVLGSRFTPVDDVDRPSRRHGVRKNGESSSPAPAQPPSGILRGCVAWLANKLVGVRRGPATRARSSCPARCTGRWTPNRATCSWPSTHSSGR